MEKFKAIPPGREAKFLTLGLWSGTFCRGPNKQRCHEEMNRWQMALATKHFKWVSLC